MAKHIKEAEIIEIDPSAFRSFLLFRKDAGEPVPLQAFSGATAPAHELIPPQLFIEVDDPSAPGAASRVREALKRRAEELGVQLKS